MCNRLYATLGSVRSLLPSARVSIASRSDSVMNRQDGLARETRVSSEGAVAPALSSFVTEASMPVAASTAESKPPVLWEFPAEGSHSAVAAADATGAAIRKAAMYASVAAAVVFGIVAGTWGARELQRGRPVATQAAAAPIANAPVVTPPTPTPTPIVMRRLNHPPSSFPRWNYGHPLARLSRELSRMLRGLRPSLKLSLTIANRAMPRRRRRAARVAAPQPRREPYPHPGLAPSLSSQR